MVSKISKGGDVKKGGGGGRTTVLECLIVPEVLIKTLHSPDKVLTFLNKTIFGRVTINPYRFRNIRPSVTVRINFFLL